MRIAALFIILMFIISVFRTDAFNLKKISPAQCSVQNQETEVLVLVSDVPGRQFITCNASVICDGICPYVFEHPRLWIANPDSNEAFACRNKLRKCELYYGSK